MADHDSPPDLRALPTLPLRDVVVFPHIVVPLFVGRQRSVAAIEAAVADPNREILLVAQVHPRTDEPTEGDLYEVGCIGKVSQIMRLPDKTVKVLVEGRARAQIHGWVEGEPYLCAEVSELAEDEAAAIEARAGDDEAPEATDAEPGAGTDRADTLRMRLQQSLERYAKANRRVSFDLVNTITGIDDPGQIADTIAHSLGLRVADRQKLLATPSATERLETLLALIEAEGEAADVEDQVRRRVGKVPPKPPSAESGEGDLADEFKAEYDALVEKSRDDKLPDAAKERLERELRKLKLMNPMSAEAGVLRTWIDWVIGLPWATYSEDTIDLPRAREVLEEDHYGLEKPKERIVEHLAVQKLRGRAARGPILCLVGPPGVGKTSLAKSIARATSRGFVRISLGGVRDEAEIRGHRRTYVGALPGKIVHALKRVGTSNPVVLLDEVDKMTMDFRGDPSSALLEVLDPEQNDAFVDHYLDLDYDLSRVLFIATANTLAQIPAPLRDRLELIELGGYTEHDKRHIARRYLLPRQIDENGLEAVDVQLGEPALGHLIRRYTREAGVRELERRIGAVCRKLATRLLDEGEGRKRFRVGEKTVEKLLGKPLYKHEARERHDRVGVVNGLAVTAHGGDLLLAEVTVLPGGGKLSFTGKLGDVMSESVQAAMAYVRSRALQLGLGREFYQRIDVHVHFPAAAISKDGPSAGVAITTALVSALTQLPVRSDVAMTGEITLRGRVLAIGGVKEKVIAAHRADVRTVLVPAENERDLDDIPDAIRSEVDIVLVEHVDEVLRRALALDDPEAFLAVPVAGARDWLGIFEEQADPPSVARH